MPIYKVRAPNGKIYSVKAPEGATQEQIFGFVQANLPKEPEGGIIGAAKRGAESLVSSGQTALESVFGDEEEAVRRGMQRQEKISEKYAEPASLERAKQAYEERGLLGGAGEVASQVLPTISEQVPQLAAMAASSRLGAMAGTAVGGLPGGIVGGLLGSAAPSFAQQYASNLQRQAQEQIARGEEVDVNRLTAAGTAIPQAAIDVGSTAILLGKTLIGKLLGETVETAIKKRGVQAVEKLAAEKLLKTVGKGVAVGGTAEIGGEVTQQMLERLQAGLSLTSEDAIKEYGETAYQTALMAPLGGLGRVAERGAARSEVATRRAVEEAEQEAARVAAAQAAAAQAAGATGAPPAPPAGGAPPAPTATGTGTPPPAPPAGGGTSATPTTPATPARSELEQKALDYIKRTGEHSAIKISGALGVKLPQAGAIRQKLIDSGDIYSVAGEGGKTEWRTRSEVAPEKLSVAMDYLAKFGAGRNSVLDITRAFKDAGVTMLPGEPAGIRNELISQKLLYKDRDGKWQIKPPTVGTTPTKVGTPSTGEPDAGPATGGTEVPVSAVPPTGFTPPPITGEGVAGTEPISAPPDGGAGAVPPPLETPPEEEVTPPEARLPEAPPPEAQLPEPPPPEEEVTPPEEEVTPPEAEVTPSTPPPTPPAPPAATAPATPPPPAEVAGEEGIDLPAGSHKTWAKDLIKAVPTISEDNPDVVYSDDDFALIRKLHANPLAIYSPLILADGKFQRSKQDITSSYWDTKIPAAKLKKLRQARLDSIKKEFLLAAQFPLGPFSIATFDQLADNLIVADGVDPRYGEYLKRLMRLVPVNQKIFLFHPKKLVQMREKYKMFFKHASILGLANDDSARGFTLEVDGVRYIAVNDDKFEQHTLEVLAHEYGHIIEVTQFKNASPAVRKQIRDEYDAWRAKTDKMTVEELLKSLRNRTNAAETLKKASPTLRKSPATTIQLYSTYWTSFDEWFADNVSKWTTTSEKPVTLTEKFFADVGKILRKFMQAITGRDYLPAPAVAEFLDGIAAVASPDFANSLRELQQESKGALIDSTGKPVHPTAEGVENFKEWFDDSEVVDDQGRPLVVYHGMEGAMEGDDFRMSPWGTLGKGVYFTSSPAAASKFATGVRGMKTEPETQGQVLPVYLQIKRPFDNKFFVGNKPWQEWAASELRDGYGLESEGWKTFSRWIRNGFTEAELVKLHDKLMKGEATVNDLLIKGQSELPFGQQILEGVRKHGGFDGIILKNSPKGFDEYLVFSPDQVKSAIGNAGTFSPKKGISASIGKIDIVAERYTIESPESADTNFKEMRSLINSLPKINSTPVEEFVRKVSGAEQPLLKGFYGLLSMTQMSELFANVMPSIKTLVSVIERRSSDMMKRREKVSKNYSKWQKIANSYKNVLPNFFRIANESTVEQIDVAAQSSRNLVNRVNSGAISRAQLTPFDQEIYDLTTDFFALPAALQTVYRELRASYEAQGDELLNIMRTTINNPSLFAQIEAKFRSKRLGVYLPLFRDGDYWLNYTDTAGETVSLAFNDPRERSQALQALTPAERATAQMQVKGEQLSRKSAPPAGFLKDVLDSMAANGAPPAALDSIYLLYLEHIPAQSLRQQFKQRAGVKGFEKDVLKVYATMAPRMESQLNNMQYATAIDQTMTDINKEQALNGSDSMGALAALENVKGQIDFIQNPPPRGILDSFSYFSYMWYILGNVSSALVNLSQMAIVVYPLLAGKYGSVRALKQWNNAVADYYKGGWDNNTEFMPDWTFGGARNLDPELRALFDAAVDQSVIRRSTGQELAEAKVVDTSEFSGKKARVEQGLGWVFQNSERANREVTLLMAYKLAREGTSTIPPKTPAEAIKIALEMSDTAHGSALAETGPRLFQTGLGKVMFVFKRFAQSQIYLLGKLFAQAFKGASPDVRSLARRQLGGIFAMAYMVAGVQGMPLYGAAALLASMTEDEDEPRDWDAQVIQWLTMVGYKGPLSVALQADIASRTGFNGLLWRDDAKRMEEIGPVLYAAEVAGGPTYGILRSFERAAKHFEEGNYDRAIEASMPAFIRNGFKAMRLAEEGALTKKGVPIVEELNDWNIFMQTFGFNPLELSEESQRAGAITAGKEKYAKRKASLLNKFDAARMSGDREGMKEIYAEMGEFNKKILAKSEDSSYLIKDSTIQKSYMQRRKQEAASVAGIYLPQKDRQILMDTVGWENDPLENVDKEEEEEE